MRVWLDDDRPMPDGYDVHARTAAEAIALIATGVVERISLDHDLGPPEAGTGYDVAKYIEESAFHGRIPTMRFGVHTQNPVGRANIRGSLRNAVRYWAERPWSDTIDPSVWSAALDSMRSRPGMGACKLEYDPYRGRWEFEINYSNNLRIRERHTDINEAIRRATEANEASRWRGESTEIIACPSIDSL